jgi:hypothetical protein
MTMIEQTSKKYGLLPPKIAKSDAVFLGHGMCGSDGSLPFTIRTPTKTHSPRVKFLMNMRLEMLCDEKSILI